MFRSGNPRWFTEMLALAPAEPTKDCGLATLEISKSGCMLSASLSDWLSSMWKDASRAGRTSLAWFYASHCFRLTEMV